MLSRDRLPVVRAVVKRDEGLITGLEKWKRRGAEAEEALSDERASGEVGPSFVSSLRLDSSTCALVSDLEFCGLVVFLGEIFPSVGFEG